MTADTYRVGPRAVGKVPAPWGCRFPVWRASGDTLNRTGGNGHDGPGTIATIRQLPSHIVTE